MLDSHDGADHDRAAARIVVVLALWVLSLAADRTRWSLCQEDAGMVAPCRPSLSEAEVAVAVNLGWRRVEVGK